LNKRKLLSLGLIATILLLSTYGIMGNADYLVNYITIRHKGLTWSFQAKDAVTGQLFGDEIVESSIDAYYFLEFDPEPHRLIILKSHVSNGRVRLTIAYESLPEEGENVVGSGITGDLADGGTFDVTGPPFVFRRRP
jgi:hypothetical protein